MTVLTIQEQDYNHMLKQIQELEEENGAMAEKHAEKDIIMANMQQEIERLNIAYEYISNAIYTQHCTMNHMENTEFERGQIRGWIQASNIVEKALGNKR